MGNGSQISKNRMILNTPNTRLAKKPKSIYRKTINIKA